MARMTGTSGTGLPGNARVARVERRLSRLQEPGRGGATLGESDGAVILAWALLHGHFKRIFGQSRAGALRPLDGENVSVFDPLHEPQILDFHNALKSVQVAVMQDQSADVSVYQHEGGTARPVGCSEPRRNSLNEPGLAGAQLAADENGVAR